MFYAEFMPGGEPRAGDTLMSFETRAERAEMVDRVNAAHGREACKAVTTREAARRYDLRGFRGEECREAAHLRTSAGRCVFEIGHRPGFRC